MTPVDKIKEKIVKKDKRKLLTFLVFLVISTVLWLLIKLSKDYTTETTFTVVYEDMPLNKWVSTPEQTVKLSFKADGFATLMHNIVRSSKRVVKIPLGEVPYRLEGGNTYSYSSQYVAERVAKRIGISASDVKMNDEKLYFNMEDLQSKEFAIRVPMNVKPKRQYQVYGTPVITPSTMTVYGPRLVLDTMHFIYTEPLVVSDVSEDIVKKLKPNYYNGAIRSDVKTVKVDVDIEQFTEIDIKVPVKVTDTLNLRIAPETINVKCLVPIRDYASIDGSSFRLLADTAQLHRLEPRLNVKLVQVPEHVKVIRMEQDWVEYLILN